MPHRLSIAWEPVVSNRRPAADVGCEPSSTFRSRDARHSEAGRSERLTRNAVCAPVAVQLERPSEAGNVDVASGRLLCPKARMKAADTTVAESLPKPIYEKAAELSSDNLSKDNNRKFFAPA